MALLAAASLLVHCMLFDVLQQQGRQYQVGGLSIGHSLMAEKMPKHTLGRLQVAEAKLVTNPTLLLHLPFHAQTILLALLSISHAHHGHQIHRLQWRHQRETSFNRTPRVHDAPERERVCLPPIHHLYYFPFPF